MPEIDKNILERFDQIDRKLEYIEMHLASLLRQMPMQKIHCCCCSQKFGNFPVSSWDWTNN